MRVAWLTPFAERGSGIAQFSATIAEELQHGADVAVFASDLTSGEQAVRSNLTLRYLPSLAPVEVLRQLDDFDSLVYNLGNDLRWYRAIYELALARPGIVVLHDLVMHHFFASYHLEYRKDPLGYIDEVEFAHPGQGRRFARAVIDGRVGPDRAGPIMRQLHMARSAIHGSEGVVVHSESARRALAAIAECPVTRIPLPTPNLAEPRPAAAYCRRLLDFAERTRYNRPILALADRAANLLRELGQTSASPLASLVAAEIGALGANDMPPTAGR